MNKITAYTDGAAKGNPGPAGWAWACGDQTGAGCFPSATNNQMELYAVIQLVESLPPESQVEIVTDSKLVVGWLSRGWRAQRRENQVLIEWFLSAIHSKRIRVTFTRVKGHLDNPGNILVDRLASDWAKLASRQIQ